MKNYILTICAMIGILSSISTVNGQIQVIKPETPLNASIDFLSCHPDVAMLEGGENFVIVYPFFAVEKYHAVFRVFNSDGELVGINKLIESDIGESIPKLVVIQ